MASFRESLVRAVKLARNQKIEQQRNEKELELELLVIRLAVMDRIYPRVSSPLFSLFARLSRVRDSNNEGGILFVSSSLFFRDRIPRSCSQRFLLLEEEMPPRRSSSRFLSSFTTSVLVKARRSRDDSYPGQDYLWW